MEKVIKTLINILVTIEFSNDEYIDEDFAVSIMEDATTFLNQLDSEEAKYFMEVAKEFAKNKQDNINSFILNLPENFGFQEKLLDT